MYMLAQYFLNTVLTTYVDIEHYCNTISISTRVGETGMQIVNIMCAQCTQTPYCMYEIQRKGAGGRERGRWGDTHLTGNSKILMGGEREGGRGIGK